jgi:FtsP/CotA-like multicopper oxidase with cupredoxin domain
MMIERRTFLALSGVASLHLLTGCGGSGSSEDSGSNGANSTKALPIPPLLGPSNRAGVNHYDLTVQSSKHEFFNGTATNTYGINSTYLGPTLVMYNGSEVSVNYSNQLSETITMHSHGMHVPARMDGTAHQPIAPNSSWSARYKVNQKASTNWYHPHTMDNTARQVYQGLAGLIIVEDNESQTLNLPKRYGVDDIPLVLQDRFFNNGQINYSPSNREVMRGYIGDTFIANGAIEPTLDVEAKEIRFRILNGSNSSVYELGFSDGRIFKQIATDNGFLEAPVSLNRLRLSPAERAEIVVDLSNAKDKTITFNEYRYGKKFVTININKNATQNTTLPGRLTSLEKFSPSSAVRTRSFILSGGGGKFLINDKSMDINRIDERVSLGEIELWEITNTMGMNHNFHIHATHFMIVARNGSPSNVAANERGYKDVVFVPANESVTVIIKMLDYTDSNVPYMYHCHFLEHEDRGMMGQFTVS